MQFHENESSAPTHAEGSLPEQTKTPGLQLSGIFTFIKNNVDLRDPRTWLALFPIYYLAVFLITSVLRLGFPYQLTWMEGAVIDHVRWILDGHQLYGPPSIDFTPYIYAPFYYYINAFFMKIFGIHTWIPRLLSFTGTVLVLVMVWRLVKQETQSTFYALSAAGFFAALYPFVRCYFDLARVDAIFLCFLMAGFYFAIKQSKPYYIYLSAFMFYLAIFTKQQAFMVILMIILALLKDNFKKCLKFCLLFGGLSIVTFLLFQWASDGWFFTYIYRLPSAHGIADSLITLMFKDLLTTMPIFFLIAPYFFFHYLRREKVSKSNYYLYVAFFIGAAIASWASRAHPGGVENVLLPILVAIAILGAISFHTLESHTKQKVKWVSQLVIPILYLAQFAILLYSPAQYIPQKHHYASNEKLIRLIKSFDGDVLIPEVGYIPYLAGKKTTSHKTAIYDIVGRPKGKSFSDLKRKVHQMYKNAIGRKEFSAIIFRSDGFLKTKMRGIYKKSRTIQTPPSLFVHAYEIKEWNVYVPK